MQRSTRGYEETFPVFLCHLRVSFSIPASKILVVDQTMPHFQVCKHNYGAHDQQVCSTASSTFQEFFPFSPVTMKSFKINLPFPVLSSTAKIVRTKLCGGVFIQSSKIELCSKAIEIRPFLSFDARQSNELARLEMVS